MSKLSTRCMDHLEKKEDNAKELKSSPRKQTLDFLRQFARVYHAEPTVCSDFCGYVLN